MACRRESELQEDESAQGRDRPAQGGGAAAQAGPRSDRCDQGERGRGGNPDPGFGRRHARHGRKQGCELHASFDRGEGCAGDQGGHQRFHHRRAGREQKHWVEHQEDDGKARLPDVWRKEVDAGRGGQAKQRAQCLQQAELPQAEELQHRGRQHVVARQPCVFHPEQRVVELSRRGQVRGDEPVPITVLERLGQLSREQQQDGRDAHQPDRWGCHPHPRERSAAEAAQRHHLDEVDQAEGRHEEKTETEHARVDRECCHRRHALHQRARIAHPNVILVSPFLARLHDAVLGCAHEDAAGSGGADQREHRVQRHPRAHDLAKQRWDARPPRTPTPGLSGHESDPWRNADQDGDR